MRKITGLLALLAILVVGGLAACSFQTGWVHNFLFGHADLEAKKAVWTEILAHELPVGSSRVQIVAWTKAHHFILDEIGQKNTFYILAEKVPDSGLVCSEWMITIEIVMSGDHSVQQNITTPGSCI